MEGALVGKAVGLVEGVRLGDDDGEVVGFAL